MIVNFLEHPDGEKPENDTGEVGNDTIPIRYTRTLEHTYCWEDENPDAMHFAELRDSVGNLILTVEANGVCVNDVIEAGNYTMTLHHDGRLETSHPVFIIPNPEDTEQAHEPGGWINRFKMFAATMLNGMQEIVARDAQTQTTVDDNLRLLFETGNCKGCDLSGANFFKADFTGADLSDTTLNDAYLDGANLTGANLTGAHMTGADLRDAISTGANLSHVSLLDAFVTNADFTGANFNNALLLSAILFNTNFTGADLSNADFRATALNGANLSSADLSDADFSLSDLSNANLVGAKNLDQVLFDSVVWCNGCVCASNSIGTCGGCPPLEEVCTGLE